MRTMLSAAVAASILAVATPAVAAVQVTDYSFSATTPASTQSGSFSIGFDDATGSYSLTAINYAIGSTTFNLANAGIFVTNSSTLTLGGRAGGPIPGPFGFPIGGDMISGGIGVIQSGADDFLLNLTRGPNGSLSAGSFSYAQASGGSGSSYAAGGSLTVTQLNGAVPEPATWALMLLGFGGIGFAMRRNRRNGALMQIA